MDKMKGWKTFVTGLAIAGLAILNNPDAQAFIAAHLQWMEAGLGTAVVLLRFVTTSPIFKSE